MTESRAPKNAHISPKIKRCHYLCRDHSRYGSSQWEVMLHYNVVQHWLSPYKEWSLLYMRLAQTNRVSMCTMASQINSLTSVYLTVYSGADQRKHESSASLAFVRGVQRWPMNSSHKWPVTRKMFPFADVIMESPERHAAPAHATSHQRGLLKDPSEET